MTISGELTDQIASTVVLVESDDIAGSVGRPGFLETHLKPATATQAGIEVQHLAGSRCEIVAQRLHATDLVPDIEVPRHLREWFDAMVAPVEVPDTTAVFVMSIAAAVTHDVWKHAASGILVQPPPDHDATWTDADNEWLNRTFDLVPATDDQMGEALRTISGRLKAIGAEFVVFNTSTFIPGEKTYWFHKGEPERMSTRAARANLTVDTLAHELDLALVDVDRVVAEIGAGAAVLEPMVYSKETLDTLAEESISIILRLEGISKVFSADAMQLTVPRYDRRTNAATLTHWHVTDGSEINKGDQLFDLKFDSIQSRSDHHGRRTGKAIEMSVVAGRTGFLDRISVDAGSSVSVGTTVGVVTTTEGIQWDAIENAAQFPVGVSVKGRHDGEE